MKRCQRVSLCDGFECWGFYLCPPWQHEVPINHCSQEVNEHGEQVIFYSDGGFALRCLSMYDSYLQGSFILGDIDPVNIFRGQHLFKNLLKAKDVKKKNKKINK